MLDLDRKKSHPFATVISIMVVVVIIVAVVVVIVAVVTVVVCFFVFCSKEGYINLIDGHLCTYALRFVSVNDEAKNEV